MPETNNPMYSINTDNVVLSPDKLAHQLENIDTMPDESGYNIIKGNYQIFLSNAIDCQCFDTLKKSSKFINLLTQVCVEVDLTYEQRVYCNSMLYKELANTDNPYMQKIYYILGWVVNREMVSRIMECGVDQVLATYLTITRKSTFNSKDNISRLNFSIMCANPDFMTVQKITDIYCAIFNNVSEVKDLFFLTIRDTYVFTSDEEWITKEILKVAHNMNYAVISLLDSLPISSLEKILTEYHNMAVIDDLDEEDVRFSFQKIDLNKFRHLAIVMTKMAEDNMILL